MPRSKYLSLNTDPKQIKFLQQRAKNAATIESQGKLNIANFLPQLLIKLDKLEKADYGLAKEVGIPEAPYPFDYETAGAQVVSFVNDCKIAELIIYLGIVKHSDSTTLEDLIKLSHICSRALNAKNDYAVLDSAAKISPFMQMLIRGSAYPKTGFETGSPYQQLLMKTVDTYLISFYNSELIGEQTIADRQEKRAFLINPITLAYELGADVLQSFQHIDTKGIMKLTPLRIAIMKRDLPILQLLLELVNHENPSINDFYIPAQIFKYNYQEILNLVSAKCDAHTMINLKMFDEKTLEILDYCEYYQTNIEQGIERKLEALDVSSHERPTLNTARKTLLEYIENVKKLNKKWFNDMKEATEKFYDALDEEEFHAASEKLQTASNSPLLQEQLVEFPRFPSITSEEYNEQYLCEVREYFNNLEATLPDNIYVYYDDQFKDAQDSSQDSSLDANNSTYKIFESAHLTFVRPESRVYMEQFKSYPKYFHGGHSISFRGEADRGRIINTELMENYIMPASLMEEEEGHYTSAKVQSEEEEEEERYYPSAKVVQSDAEEDDDEAFARKVGHRSHKKSILTHQTQTRARMQTNESNINIQKATNAENPSKKKG